MRQMFSSEERWGEYTLFHYVLFLPFIYEKRMGDAAVYFLSVVLVKKFPTILMLSQEIGFNSAHERFLSQSDQS